MTESRLRAFVGLFLVCAQFTLILLVIMLYVVPRPRGFKFEEMTTMLGILAPAFAAYTLPIVRHIIANRFVQRKGRRIGAQFVVISLLFPILFTLVVAASVLAQAYGWAFDNFEQFKTFFGVLQTVFAVYVGNTVGSLFDFDAPAPPAHPAAQPDPNSP